MNTGQYRALVAYLNFWTPQYPSMDLNKGIEDIGIKMEREDVIHELFKAGWNWDDKLKILTYED